MEHLFWSLTWGVDLVVSFTTLHKLVVVNSLMGTIVLDTFRTLNIAHTSCMSPFPAVFALQYSRVYICSIHYSNEVAYIEMPVDDSLGFRVICYDRYIKDVAWTRVKGMMSMIGCAEVVSVSTSCSRCYSLT